MALHKINKGLEIPISGDPEQTLHEAAPCSRVAAVVAADYHGMKPRMNIQVGDLVKRGTLLFENRKVPGVRFTAPASGTVAAINRGERRALQSLVIDLSDSERQGRPQDADFEPFSSYTGKPVAELSGEQVRALLVESGLWTALRTRPFSKVPAPETSPAAVFVTAADTAPLAPSVDVVLGEQNRAGGNQPSKREDFELGLTAVAKLTQGKTYLCKMAGTVVSAGSAGSAAGVRVEEFAGKHPAGNAGVHIHALEPVNRERVVWHVGYQDVVTIGRLFATGKLDVERVVSLAGPGVRKPRLLRTRVGAHIDEVVARELADGDLRVVSGSVLVGREARGEVHGYLGRYHNQISVLPEGGQRELLGWLGAGFGKFSTIPAYLSKLLVGKRYALNTSTYGSPRAMVPIGMYERVMPMDIMPTFLLRALIMEDTERAEQLGCLELDEEDLALCTFVCPGKYDYGQILRDNLTQIETD